MPRWKKPRRMVITDRKDNIAQSGMLGAMVTWWAKQAPVSFLKLLTIWQQCPRNTRKTRKVAAKNARGREEKENVSCLDFFVDMYPEKGYNVSMKYDVVVKKKVLKRLEKLPLWVQKKLSVLVQDLKEKGPEQPMWQNYSKLSRTEYHCHLGSSWAACWRHHKKTIVIEVYYVGSREKAPY